MEQERRLANFGVLHGYGDGFNPSCLDFLKTSLADPQLIFRQPYRLPPRIGAIMQVSDNWHASPKNRSKSFFSCTPPFNEEIGKIGQKALSSVVI